MILKGNRKILVILLAHIVVLGFFLYPTIMELFNESTEAMSYDEVTQVMEEKPHVNGGKFGDGEIVRGRVPYAMTIGSLRIQSIIA